MESKAETMDYIEKLKNSFTQEELEKMLAPVSVDLINPPHFDFGTHKFFPKDDFNVCLEGAYTHSDLNKTTSELEEKVRQLEEFNESKDKEINSYVDEITRLEEELKECKEQLKEKVEYRKYHTTRDEKFTLTSAKEIYEGELLCCLLDALDEYSKNHKPESPTKGNRAYTMVEEIKNKFGAEAYISCASAANRFRKSIERAVDKACDSSSTDLKPLLDVGFEDITSDNSKHYKVRFKDDNTMVFSIARTPSAHSAKENCKRGITSRLCIN